MLPCAADVEAVVECVRPSIRRGLCLRPGGVDFWNFLPVDLLISCYRVRGESIYPRMHLYLPSKVVGRSMTLPERRSDERYVFAVEAHDRTRPTGNQQWDIMKDMTIEYGSCVLFRSSTVDSAAPLSNPPVTNVAEENCVEIDDAKDPHALPGSDTKVGEPDAPRALSRAPRSSS